MPPAATKYFILKLGQNSPSPTFWPHPTLKGMWCQWSLSNLRLTYSPSLVTVWPPKQLNIALLSISGTELRTDKWTDRQTDWQTIKILDAPGGPFRPGPSVDLQLLCPHMQNSAAPGLWSDSADHQTGASCWTVPANDSILSAPFSFKNSSNFNLPSLQSLLKNQTLLSLSPSTTSVAHNLVDVRKER